MKQRIAVLLMLGLMPWAEVHAQSQTVSATFKVSARVEAVCEVTATDLPFGIYSAQGEIPQTSTPLLRATCTPDTTDNVGLNEGTSPGATANQRKMVSRAQSLNTVSGVGSGLAQDYTVFGGAPAAQVVRAGDPADTITVRVYY